MPPTAGLGSPSSLSRSDLEVRAGQEEQPEGGAAAGPLRRGEDAAFRSGEWGAGSGGGGGGSVAAAKGAPGGGGALASSRTEVEVLCRVCRHTPFLLVLATWRFGI